VAFRAGELAPIFCTQKLHKPAAVWGLKGEGDVTSKCYSGPGKIRRWCIELSRLQGDGGAKELHYEGKFQKAMEKKKDSGEGRKRIPGDMLRKQVIGSLGQMRGKDIEGGAARLIPGLIRGGKGGGRYRT